MNTISLTANSNALTITDPVDLTTGQVNYTDCLFTFDAAWEGMAKTAVFYTNKTSRKSLLIAPDGTCTVPWEDLLQTGILYIGVFGIKDAVVLSTNFAVLRVKQGTYVIGEVPPPPTLDVYVQIMAEFTNVRAFVTDKADIATSKAAEASASGAAALVSENAAKVSEDNAAASEGNASSSAAAALASKNAAALSQTNAAASAASASASEESAGLSAAAASASEIAAGTSATVALNSKNAAKASEDAAQVSQVNAALSEAAAEASEIAAAGSAAAASTSAGNALSSQIAAASSESAALQAMTDYLAMIGVDIATLVGGKVPMSQIPATATQEIYTITSVEEITTLVAQRGDLAELIQTVDGEPTIVKSYQLLGDGDPTIASNWVVWGTSYAVQAGNASTATNAENSTMINGHRLVTMNQAQYDIAAIVVDTLYAVFPTEV